MICDSTDLSSFSASKEAFTSAYSGLEALFVLPFQDRIESALSAISFMISLRLIGEVFRGRRNRTVLEECGRWLFYLTDLFLPSIDTETGDFRNPPFPGSMADQPYMTMQLLKLMQLNYRKHLAEKAESLKLKKNSR